MGFAEKLKRADGSAYGSFILTVAAILFLLLLLPTLLSVTATVATQSATKEVKHLPRQDLPGTAATGGGGVYWSNFTNGPITAALAALAPNFGDCVPYDGVTDGDYPLTESGWPRFNDSHSNIHWTRIGGPFRAGQVPITDPWAAFSFCSTMNDEIGFKLNSSLAFSTDDNLAMTRFNASIVKFDCSISCPQYNATPTRQINYSWHIAIGGERVFGGEVFAIDGHADSFSRTTCYRNCTPSGIVAGNARYYPTTKFQHDLSLEETFRVRELLSKENINTLDVRIFLTCYTPVTGVDSSVSSDCQIIKNALATGTSDDFYFHAAADYVQADDWQLLVKGVLFISSAFMLTMAVGSTPAWDPFKKMLGGV